MIDHIATTISLAGWIDGIAYPLVDALDQSALANYVKASMTIVPWAGVFHLISIAVLGGAVFMVDMRTLGAGLTSQTPAAIHRTVRPLLILALIGTILSGTILALGELMKLYYSPPYWVKMGALLAALLFTFGVRNAVIQETARFSLWTILLAILSLTLFIGIFVTFSSPLARMAMGLLIVTLAMFAWLARRDGPMEAGAWVKATAATSITMWLTVAAAGRWIAFY